MDDISRTAVLHFEKYVHLSTCTFQDPIKFFKKQSCPFKNKYLDFSE